MANPRSRAVQWNGYRPFITVYTSDGRSQRCYLGFKERDAANQIAAAVRKPREAGDVREVKKRIAILGRVAENVFSLAMLRDKS